MTEEIKKARDRKLRRKILFVAKMAMPHAPNGELSGDLLVDQVRGLMRGSMGFEDDEHAFRLCRELVTYGLLIERDTRARKGERFGLDTVNFKLAPGGLMLLNEANSPHPDVDDDRME